MRQIYKLHTNAPIDSKQYYYSELLQGSIWTMQCPIQAICAFSFVVPKSYTIDVRVKVPLENKVCIEHNTIEMNFK